MKPGQPLDGAYTDENTDLVAAGCSNLVRHIENTKSFGIPVVVAINSFPTDTADELEIVRRAAIEAGAEDAVVCTHHSEVGKPFPGKFSSYFALATLVGEDFLSRRTPRS